LDIGETLFMMHHIGGQKLYSGNPLLPTCGMAIPIVASGIALLLIAKQSTFSS